MATSGHESELINVSGLKSSLQKLKTSHIDTKAAKTAAVTTVGYSSSTITKTINGTASNVVTASTIVTDGGGLKSHQTIKQDGVTGATGNHYGVCSTAAATAAKAVNITGTPTLEAGLHVFVKFSNANTASNPTLNVNSLGAKNIYINGEQITTDSKKLALLKDVCEFVYDGTQFNIMAGAGGSGGNYNGDVFGVFAYYSDGTLKSKDFADSDAIGVALITSNYKFVIDKTEITDLQFGGADVDLSSLSFSTDTKSEAEADFNGEQNTINIINALDGHTQDLGPIAPSVTGAPVAEACRARFDGRGYLGGSGEMKIIWNYLSAINDMMSKIGGTIFNGYYWTSTLGLTPQHSGSGNMYTTMYTTWYIRMIGDSYYTSATPRPNVYRSRALLAI